MNNTKLDATYIFADSFDVFDDSFDVSIVIKITGSCLSSTIALSK